MRGASPKPTTEESENYRLKLPRDIIRRIQREGQSDLRKFNNMTIVLLLEALSARENKKERTRGTAKENLHA